MISERFPSICPTSNFALFIRQIGVESATLLRYICIQLFGFGALSDKFELIREFCTSLAILQLECDPEDTMLYILESEKEQPAFVTHTLDSLNLHVKTISSLKEVIVNFNVYRESSCNTEKSDRILKKLQQYGWTIKITEIWKSEVHNFTVFDNEEERDAYDSGNHPDWEYDLQRLMRSTRR